MNAKPFGPRKKTHRAGKLMGGREKGGKTVGKDCWAGISLNGPVVSRRPIVSACRSSYIPEGPTSKIPEIKGDPGVKEKRGQQDSCSSYGRLSKTELSR